jgi:hypothetical protein
MALPLILSLLGSGLAGAGALGGLGILGSPLIAGAIGRVWVRPFRKKTSVRVSGPALPPGLLGGLGGALVGVARACLANPATATAGNCWQCSGKGGTNRTSRDDVSYAIWLFWSYGPDGVQQVYGCPRNFGGDGIPVPRCYARGSQPRRPHRCRYRRCAARCYAGHDTDDARIKPQTGPGREPVPFNRKAAQGPRVPCPALIRSAVLRPTSVGCAAFRWWWYANAILLQVWTNPCVCRLAASPT